MNRLIANRVQAWKAAGNKHADEQTECVLSSGITVKHQQ